MALSLGTTILTLHNVSIPVFNLAKYFLMTYFVGLIWDAAYIAALETKRYLSLKYTGGFSVSTWGRSRNNLFSGSNFELIFAWTGNRNRGSDRVIGKGQLGKIDPVLEKPVEKAPSLGWRGIWFELGILALIFLVVCCEAASELYTDSTDYDQIVYRNANVPVRELSSKVILSKNYAAISDILLVRRCAQNEESYSIVIRPNLVVEKGNFAFNRIPHYKQKVMCLFDKKVSSFSTVKFSHRYTTLEGAEKLTSENIEKLRKLHDIFDQKLPDGDVPHALYEFRVVGTAAIPHFSQRKPITKSEHLLSVFINGRRYTCTKINVWCIARVDDAYQVVYPQFRTDAGSRGDAARTSEANWTNVTAGTNSLEYAVQPIRVPVKAWPKLAHDRYMMRPLRGGSTSMDIIENLQVITIGYNWGWTTKKLEQREAIVSHTPIIVPTVQLGYVVSFAVVIIVSVILLCSTAVLARRRKIRGLVGEYAFVDRWHGHIEADGCGDGCGAGLLGRNRLIVAKTSGDAGHLQPPAGKRATPLTAIDKME